MCANHGLHKDFFPFDIKEACTTAKAAVIGLIYNFGDSERSSQ
jgi:hypothetical protein